MNDLTIFQGKRVGRDRYIHRSCIAQSLGQQLLEIVQCLIERVGTDAASRANVIKMNDNGSLLSLLNYPHFQADPFPALAESWTCHPNGQVTYRTYRESLNPPILHRKELMVPPDWPDRDHWIEVTHLAESLGLFDETSTIGFRMNWERQIAARGYSLVNSQLVPLGNNTSSQIDAEDLAILGSDTGIQRHRTALSRSSLSAPIQALLRHDLLSSEVSLFDYGCGRGGDVALLKREGYQASGWDPYFASTSSIHAADLVNLGFVVNVIEDPAERVEAIQSAFKLAHRALIVSVMLHDAQVTGVPWRDGYRTQRDTFQKYFVQDEFRDYLELVLETPAILIGPGIALVFKDKDWEQRFLARKYRRVKVAEWLVQRARTGGQRVREPAPPRRRAQPHPTHEQQLLEAAGPLLDQIWMQVLDLGRWPEREEVNSLLEIEQRVGSWNRALRLLRRHYNQTLLEEAAKLRREDLLLLFVVLHFQKRRAYKSFEPRLQRDIRTFFGSYELARSEAARLLMATADTEAVAAACDEASHRGLGHLEPGRSLHVQASWTERLPVVLRAFVACAQVLWGETGAIDAIKIHIPSGKVTLLQYENFDSSPLPRLKRRIKVSLRQSDYHLFDYGSPQYPEPYLYWKSHLLNEDSPDYLSQLAFDKRLAGLGIDASLEHGPPPDSLARTLSRHRLGFDGQALCPSQSIPDLDQLCGQVFRYRDLIECGETQQRLALPNVPLNPHTYNALHALCVNVLDPVMDYFGKIRLTYGFCSPTLARQIKTRIAPHLDQHAGCELVARGRPVCDRAGAAVDFIVDDEDMREVAMWIIANTPFDRLYFYGVDSPIHVSFGPQSSRAAYEMAPNRTGARVPRPFRH